MSRVELQAVRHLNQDAPRSSRFWINSRKRAPSLRSTWVERAPPCTLRP